MMNVKNRRSKCIYVLLLSIYCIGMNFIYSTCDAGQFQRHLDDIEILPRNQTENITELELKEVFTALGYLTGQAFAVQWIKQEYPSLSLYAQKAEMEFESVFGRSQRHMVQAVKNTVGDNEYQKALTLWESQVKPVIEQQISNYDIAINWIAELELRAKGEIPSPVREVLLYYQFKNAPAEEITYGFKQIYNTKGHNKAMGLELQIEFPSSWSRREGIRPHIIQFFESHNKIGHATNINIAIEDLLKSAKDDGIIVSPEEMTMFETREGAEVFCKEIAASEEFVRNTISGMGLHKIQKVSHESITLDGWPGRMIECVGEVQRGDVQAAVYFRLYICLYKNYLINLTCGLGGLTEDALKVDIESYIPLFQLIANSLVIITQYK